MSLRSDIVSFWFWGYRCDIRTELQAPLEKESERLKYIYRPNLIGPLILEKAFEEF